MLETLFGWITKPKLEWTVIDELISGTEIFLLIILIISVIAIILTVSENKNRRNYGKVKKENSN